MFPKLIRLSFVLVLPKLFDVFSETEFFEAHLFSVCLTNSINSLIHVTNSHTHQLFYEEQN